MTDIQKKMGRQRYVSLFFLSGLVVALVIALSFLSVKLWGGKPEGHGVKKQLVFREDMTVKEFGETNGLPNAVLKKAFGLQTKADLQKRIKDVAADPAEVRSKIGGAIAVESEYQTKNWVKIPLKFGLWIVFLAIVFFFMRHSPITPLLRRGLYMAAVFVFGIVLGSDPSPMGTVKDAIVLLGEKGVIFPPRMIAFAVFVLVVFIANKYICAWGCQLGALQDLLFRLNRDKKDHTGRIRQYKVPFVVTNSVRVIFFIVLCCGAFLWSADVIEPIDPFKLYKPGTIGTIGAIFIGALLIASLFVYRPWCHLFCPFGFVGWLVEKISLFKIQVSYDTCIACKACSRACPSHVMDAILKRDRVIPDCFACGTCIGVCPTNSIRFRAGKREKPPEGKFGISG